MRVEKFDGNVLDDGAGAGGWDCDFAGEADDVVAEVGVYEEGEVAEEEHIKIKGPHEKIFLQNYGEV
ncbi:hypothetical protein QQ045_017145 [Rhodiola kirilowii]